MPRFYFRMFVAHARKPTLAVALPLPHSDSQSDRPSCAWSAMRSCCLIGWRHLFAQVVLVKVRFPLDVGLRCASLLGELGRSSVEWGSAFAELAPVPSVRLGKPMAFAMRVPLSMAPTSTKKEPCR